MELIKKLLNQTCYFVGYTTEEGKILSQEYGSGTSGHLGKWPIPKDDKFAKYAEFLFYPDPNNSGEYRIIVVGWPGYHVILESNRARITAYADSAEQRFQFRLARKPANDFLAGKEWVYVKGVGTKKHFDFPSRYLDPTNEDIDRAKLSFIPVKEVKPDLTQLVKSDNEYLVIPPVDGEEILGGEYEPKVISVEALPAAIVEDDQYENKVAQIELNPYYYLRHEQLWSSKVVDSITLAHNMKTTKKITYSSHFKNSTYKSIEKTVGYTFDAAIELSGKGSVEGGEEGAKAKAERGAKLNLAFQYKNQTKTIEGSDQVTENTVSQAVETHYTNEKENTILKMVRWVLIDRYTLMTGKNSNGEVAVKGTWDFVSPSEPRLQMVYTKVNVPD